MAVVIGTRAQARTFAERVICVNDLLAEAKQCCPLRIVAVVVGASGTQAHAFADHVIYVNDLLAEREKLRGAVAEVV